MVVFGRVAPTIPVLEMNRSLNFYRDTLGFELVFTNGDPVTFAVVRRDAAELHLKVDLEHVGTSHLHLMVDDLDSLYLRLVEAHTPIRQPPTVQAWKLRDLIVTDPDGNSLEIAELQ